MDLISLRIQLDLEFSGKLSLPDTSLVRPAIKNPFRRQAMGFDRICRFISYPVNKKSSAFIGVISALIGGEKHFSFFCYLSYPISQRKFT